MNKNEVLNPDAHEKPDTWQFNANNISNPNDHDLSVLQFATNEDKPIETNHSIRGSNSDYSGPIFGRLCSKLSRNYLLVITLLVIIGIYYFYVHWNIVSLLAKSKPGVDFQFWKKENLRDSLYTRAFIYLFIFHLLFLIFTVLLSKLLVTDPGYLSDQDYFKIFSWSNIVNGTFGEDTFNLQGLVFDLDEPHKIFDTSYECKDESEERKSKIVLLYIGQYKKINLFKFIATHKADLLTSRKICKTCKVIKPDRTHHCRVCSKCVLRFDHHCIFLSTCIGVNNYKYFTQLLLYSILILILCLSTSIEGIFIFSDTYGWEVSYTKIFVGVYILMVILFLSVLDLFLFHMMILCHGMTTVENKDTNKKQESHKSFAENINDSCGESSCCFVLCPTSRIYYNYNYNRASFKIWGILHGKHRRGE